MIQFVKVSTKMDVPFNVQYPDLKLFALWRCHSVSATSQEFPEIHRLIILSRCLTLPTGLSKSKGPLGGARNSVLPAAK